MRRARRIFKLKSRRGRGRRYSKPARKMEVKAQSYVGNQPLFSFARSPDNSIPALQISPGSGNLCVYIPQGTTQSARIGNRINTKRCYLRYTLEASPYGTTNPKPMPYIVKWFLGRKKAEPTLVPTGASTIGASDYHNLFQYGNTSREPGSDYQDLNREFNRDAWVIFKTWQDKIGFSSYGFTVINNDDTNWLSYPGSHPGNAFFANNDFKMFVNRKINVTRFLKKEYAFNDMSEINQNPVLCLFALLIPMSTEPTGQTEPLKFSWEVNYKFTDP